MRTRRSLHPSQLRSGGVQLPPVAGAVKVLMPPVPGANSRSDLSGMTTSASPPFPFQPVATVEVPAAFPAGDSRRLGDRRRRVATVPDHVQHAVRSAGEPELTAGLSRAADPRPGRRGGRRRGRPRLLSATAPSEAARATWKRWKRTGSSFRCSGRSARESGRPRGHARKAPLPARRPGGRPARPPRTGRGRPRRCA